LRAGTIVHMVDSYDPSVTAETAAWMERNGVTLDGSYV
jgi:hypothetical protein